MTCAASAPAPNARPTGPQRDRSAYPELKPAGMTTLLPRAILFDMDNTILDLNGAMNYAWGQVCEAVAASVEGLTPQALREALTEERRWYFGDDDRHRRGRLEPDLMLEELCAGALARVGVHDDAPRAAMVDGFRALRVESVRAYPGALETLAELKVRGVMLALVTNGSTRVQRPKIRRMQLEQYFNHVQVEEEFGAGKPEPGVYLHALTHLGVEPGDAWMVGDNLEWEVAAPQRQGMVGIWVDAAGNGLPEDSTVTPDRIIRSITELC